MIHYYFDYFTTRKRNENLLDNLPRLLLICGRSEAGLISVIEQVKILCRRKNAFSFNLFEDKLDIFFSSNTYRFS